MWYIVFTLVLVVAFALIERNATKLGITPEAMREAIEDFRYEEQLF